MSKQELCLVCKSPQEHYFTYRGYEYYRCNACGQVSTYPYPTTKTIIDHYSKKFKKGNYQLLNKYAEDYKKNVYSYFVTLIENRLKSMGTTFQKKTVLDVGCFTADFLELAQEKGAIGYGVELQKDAVKIANKKIPGRVIQFDVMSDKFPSRKYDVITLQGVIEHVTDPRKLIDRVEQLLKPGGLIMLQTPNSGSALSRIMKKYWPPFEPVEHIHLFTRGSLESLLQQSGFTDISYQMHWKKLPIGYVYNQFRNFGPEIFKIIQIFNPIVTLFSKLALRFYIGEMIVIAVKKK